MKNIKLNISGEIFDVKYENDVAVAISRLNQRRFEANCVYSLIELIRKSN